jgi:uncharacterized protein
LRVPSEDLIEFILAKGRFDTADDWIAQQIELDDIVITANIPLVNRCLQRGARVLRPDGVEFTQDAIGSTLATRALLDMLRQSGQFSGGPAPFVKADRSRFLAKLDETIHAIRRNQHR